MPAAHTSPQRQTLAERLVEARVASGYTVPKQAAEAAGITPSALYQLEDGKTRRLRSDTAEKLAAIYKGFSISWLISGAEPKYVTAGVKVQEAFSPDYALSQVLRIDPERIAAALKLVRLAFLNIGKEIDQEENGVPVAVAYEFLAQRDESQVTGENVVEFSVLARKLREQDEARTEDQHRGTG